MSGPRWIAAADLDLSKFIRPGDRIVVGQAAGEPVTLTEALVAQRAAIGPVSVFLGLCLSKSFQPEHADHIDFQSFGPMGASRALAKAGVLDISPIHYGQISRYIEDNVIGCDVAFVLLSPPGPDGRHSFGLLNDYNRAAMARARVVIAEVSDQVPWVYAEGTPDLDRITVIVETSRPPLTAAPAKIGPVDDAIGRNVARYIEDGCTLQIGMGAIPEAVARVIGDRRDLGFHSGMAGDFVVDLIESGVITNARKEIDTGISVTAVLVGRDKLYQFVDRNLAFKLRPSWHTHDGDLHGLKRFVSVNSALEVDLTGQVGAEETGGQIVSAIGGQPDFVRAGHRSNGGRTIIALPSTARGGLVSRIVQRLSGPVSTARSDVDVVVTEHGWAELKGRSLSERGVALRAIADPAHREALGGCE
ncbi:acetyl-CoA hydrolase [Alphaproteobacteria bacterium]|nr:acetyl-CoA hydrolase [Alphaproteobacteria bacterium]